MKKIIAEKIIAEYLWREWERATGTRHFETGPTPVTHQSPHFDADKIASKVIALLETKKCSKEVTK
jgi:hypothetical protein